MSIRLKLTIMFLAIALIPATFIAALSFGNYRKSLEASRLRELQDKVIFKADKIETYFKGLKANIETAQGFYNIKKNLPILTRISSEPDSPEFLISKKMLDEQLQSMQKNLGLLDIMLVNNEGNIVYSSNPEHGAKDLLHPLPDPEQKGFREGKTRVYITDIFFNQALDNKLSMLITAPAFDFDGSFIGVIAFEVDMASTYAIIQDVTGLGKTGETLVGKKIGDGALFLNPLRHDPQAALKRKSILGEEAGFPIQEAVSGRSGAGVSIDYRDKQVIASWRYMPFLDWGVVGKIDTSEAFADVENLKKLVVVILVIVFILAGIIAFSIAQSISEPIKRLSKGAEIIGGGNLDYRIISNQKDEVGQLSRSFDKMTQNLKRVMASRDELNREISERKKAEEDLRRSNENLEQFAYVASHDLQEPLRVMASYSQLLERRYKNKLDTGANEFIGFIVDAAGRMQRLINDLLAYSRVGRKDGLLSEVDCNEVLRRVIESMSAIIEPTNAKVTSDVLPALKGYESSLVQLFQNLIGNALKFHGKEPPWVHVSARENNKEWIFSVKDNGIGIEPQYRERIFLIFQRLHSKEEYPGTGIGLSICKKIVENYGGRMWVESEPQKGSTFYFTIPTGGG